jgi:DNA polymerase III alpha subunit (gram-positive type)
VTYLDASASSASASSASAVSKADISGDVPGYTMPTISGEASAGASEITDTITAGAGLTDYFDWWNELGTMIETDEDIELAQTQLQKIRAYVEAYSQAMQNQLNEFNQENVRYQANIQAEIALHNSNLRKALQDAQQATAVALQNSQQTTAVSLQNKAKAMETAIANNESALSKHRSQTQEYQARVGEAIQKYSSDIQKYAADVQRYQAQYQWYAEQQKSLDSQYQRALQPFVNAPQPQKQ